ncbi:hypothetical protein KRP22_011488 [Phytophthora ramorum]|nr:hypothetical protein KRP22_10692 [Phytophthora ramorum]
MEIARMQRWCFFVAVLVQLLTVRCDAALSTDTTLSACDYASENLYVVNASGPQDLLPLGYVDCANTTGSDAALCEVCSCREKKVASVASVAVAWVVCVGSGDATACAASSQEYCGSSSGSSVGVAAGGLHVEDDGSSSCEGLRINVGDYTSEPNASSDTSATNGSDGSSEVIIAPTSSSTPAVDSISSSTDASASSGTTVDSISSSTDASTSIDTTVDSISSSTDASASNDIGGRVDPAGDSTSGSNASSSTSVPDGSDNSAEGIISPTPRSTPTVDSISSSTDASASIDTTVDSISSSTDASASIDTTVDSISSSTDASMDTTGDTNGSVGSASSSSAKLDTVATMAPGSGSQAENEDNVVTDTVEPSQSNADPTTDQHIIRPSDNSANQLDTNNGTSSKSSWSGKQLTVVVSTLCGIAAVAAIAVFVAVRKDRARKKNELGTPADDFTDDDSSLATPMTHRLDGKYQHGKCSSRYYSNGLSSSRDHTPLASIVVIGPDDDFHTPSAYASHQYRSYSGRNMSTVQDDTVAATCESQRQFNVSCGPSMSDSAVSGPDRIFDTNNTQMSFSSNMSSEYVAPEDDGVYESEESVTDSFRVASVTDSESVRDSDASALSEDPQDADEATYDGISSATVSFDSSLSSLNSSQYDNRDTGASEHLRDSEDAMLNTNSSRVAMSFDVGSASSEA